jgi:hypothetical protein
MIRSLKGHGNEADFLGFLQKLVPHRSLTLPFDSAVGFKFADMSRQDADSGSRQLVESKSRHLNV